MVCKIPKEMKEDLLKSKDLYQFELIMYKSNFEMDEWKNDSDLVKHHSELREKGRREGYSLEPDCIQLGYLYRKKK